MSLTKICLCEIDLYLPCVSSLKEKRSIIKSLLAKMRHQFNVANAEVGEQDTWQSATIAVTAVSSSSKIVHQTMQSIIKWMESHFPDAVIVDYSTEML